MSLWTYTPTGQQVRTIMNTANGLLVQDTKTKERFLASSADLKPVFQEYNMPIEVPTDQRKFSKGHYKSPENRD